MGMEGFELSHVTPGAVDVSFSVVVAPDALVAFVTTSTPPPTTAKMPMAINCGTKRRRPLAKNPSLPLPASFALRARGIRNSPGRPFALDAKRLPLLFLCLAPQGALIHCQT